MGQFSWLYSDNGKQMVDNKRADSYLLVPPAFQDKYGKYIHEDCYDGYGHMGNYDVYELVAEWNKEFLLDTVGLIKAGKWKNENFATRLVDDMLRYYHGQDIRCELRDIGIALVCRDEDNARLLYPLKITSKPMEYDEASPSKDDPNQGWEAVPYEGMDGFRARELLSVMIDKMCAVKPTTEVTGELFSIGFTADELMYDFDFSEDEVFPKDEREER